jgi:uncharacterized protein YbgA (DUF1722 family)/uncharacterized protein YbbK (DUF523 family)
VKPSRWRSREQYEELLRMKRFPRPNVVISNCLELSACRYNGQLVHDDFVKKLSQHVNYIPVCPEVAIGLGVPRFPIRMVSHGKEIRLIQPATKSDLTDKMNKFCDDFLSRLNDVDGFILKFRSPTCGLKDVRIYPKAEKSAPVGKTAGFFGGKVLEVFPGLAIEDEGRLKSLKVREHFLTKLFTLASYREVKKSHTISDLTSFHADHKFLLMAYSQKELRILGNIASNRDKNEIGQILIEYETHLRESMASPSKRSSNINVFTHIFGYFSKHLSANEKQFYLQTVQLYREGRVPFTSVLGLLKGWAIRFQEEYLMRQSFFEPFPVDLIEWSDAGRAIEL